MKKTTLNPRKLSLKKETISDLNKFLGGDLNIMGLVQVNYPGEKPSAICRTEDPTSWGSACIVSKIYAAEDPFFAATCAYAVVQVVKEKGISL